jgi:VanZ family protein
MSRKAQVRLLNLSILLILAFIWGNSMMTAQESGGMSKGLLAILGEFIPFFAGGAHHGFLRKLAHFSEFFLLGVVCAAQRVKSKKLLTFGLIAFGLTSACIDETIQIFVLGRSSSLLDVWVDIAGFATGVIVVATVYAIANKRNKK